LIIDRRWEQGTRNRRRGHRYTQISREKKKDTGGSGHPTSHSTYSSKETLIALSQKKRRQEQEQEEDEEEECRTRVGPKKKWVGHKWTIDTKDWRRKRTKNKTPNKQQSHSTRNYTSPKMLSNSNQHLESSIQQAAATWVQTNNNTK